MPRFYNLVRPSANKAINPGQEKKSGKPSTPPAPPKDGDKTGEGAGK